MDEIGKRLVRFLVFGLVALVVVQGLMTNDNIRFYLSLGERLEGQEVTVPTAVTGELEEIEEIPCSTTSPGSFYLELQDYTSLDKVRILVNGQEMGRMSESRVKLYVTSGDVIEIDTQEYNEPITLKITSVTPNLAFPEDGMTFTSQRAVTMLGKVAVK
ncbi:MAG: hypothetical protein ACOX4Q_05840 [Syntrophomonadales bacterium]